MNKKIKIIIAVVVFFISIGLLLFSYYLYEISPVSNDKSIIEIEVPKGSSGTAIANILESKGLIRNSNIFRLYLKIHNINKINYGTYEFNKMMSTKQIAEILKEGKVKNIKLTFNEGKNIRGIAKIIAANTNNTESDVFELLEDDEYINSLIDEYWFLDDVIKNKNIYYPLEGYLAPDTYQFSSKDVSVKTIFKEMLDQTGKILTKYKDKFKNYTIHEYLTLASMVELEGKSSEDRRNIAGVFNNRLAINMSLGSDVTTYYALKIDDVMGYIKDHGSINYSTYNLYNTRSSQMGGKLPIGPICSPSEDAIEAVINPLDNDYYYFIADKNGKVYFTKTSEEHYAEIAKLKAAGLWLES